MEITKLPREISVRNNERNISDILPFFGFELGEINKL
jgi:hypothetical protein